MEHIWLQLRKFGQEQFAKDLLVELSKMVLVPYEHKIHFDDAKSARRLENLLRKLLGFYPALKEKVSLSVRGTAVLLTITDRLTRKGSRRPK